MPTQVHVNGSAQHYAQPERGTLRVSISLDGINKEELSNKVISKANELSAMFKELSPKDEKGSIKSDAAVTFWSMSSLTAYVQWQSKKKSVFAVPEYAVSVSLSAKFQNFGVLSDVVATLSRQPLVRILPVTWALTDATKARLISSLRKEAVLDAQTKARDYADALGLSTLECEEIHSNHEDGPGAAAPQMYGAMSRGTGVGGATEPQSVSIDLKPADVNMGVTVSAKFVAS